MKQGRLVFVLSYIAQGYTAKGNEKWTLANRSTANTGIPGVCSSIKKTPTSEVGVFYTSHSVLVKEEFLSVAKIDIL